MDEIEELKILLKELSKKDIKYLHEAWQECLKQDYLQYFPKICVNSFLRDLSIEDYEEFILDKNESIEDRYAKYFRLLFEYNNHNKRFEEDTNRPILKKLYKSLLQETLQNYKIECIDNDVKVNDRLYIFTNQYLPNSTHSPSIVLEKVYGLLKSFFKEIYIISSTPYPYPYPDRKHEFFNYSGIEENTFYKLDENVFLVECRGYITESLYIDFIKEQKLTKNDKFFLVGGSNIQFDIIESSNKIVITLGTINRELSTSNYLINELDDVKEKNLLSKKFKIIKCPSDFTKENNFEFKPKDLSNKEIINIAIVGNRLDKELDEEFFKKLIDTKNKIKNIRFKIIGDFLNEEIIPKDLDDYIECVGVKNNLAKYYFDEIDFYLNPNRDGGGHSCVIAYKIGIPIITLPKGDVYQSLSKRYSIESFDKIADFINNYIFNKEFKENIDDINRDLISSSNENFNKMVEQIINIGL